MYGAIIGDIAGSKYEFNNIKTKNFPFFSSGCRYTDDSAMTIAVAQALLDYYRTRQDLKTELINSMREIGRRHINAGYGGMFYEWLLIEYPNPYRSYGNGAAMRVSPCALIASTLEEALSLAAASAVVTHNHPEGIKGAQAAAGAIWLARKGASKEDIKDFIHNLNYDISNTLDEIRPTFGWDYSCQGTIPPAIIAFLESIDFEDAIRNAVSLGGDSDTIAAITGSIAWSYYGRNGLTPAMELRRDQAREYLSPDLLTIVDEFEEFRKNIKI